MNRALKGVFWTFGAYVGLQVAARLIRRRWPTPLPATLSWLSSRPLALRMPDVPWIRDALELERGMHVLAMGAGLAALCEPIAVAVGTEGRLVVSDRSEAMLHRLVERVGELTNLTTVAADPRELPCADGMFDRILLGSGLGGVPEPARVLREVFRLLKPRGQLVVAEDALDLDFLSERTVTTLALRAGFTLCARQGGAWRYLLVFERPPAPTYLHAPHEEHRIETYG
ncbi:MAG TPA: class I SAM-dependent methyltransferase [Stenomitos sp.]